MQLERQRSTKKKLDAQARASLKSHLLRGKQSVAIAYTEFAPATARGGGQANSLGGSLSDITAKRQNTTRVLLLVRPHLCDLERHDEAEDGCPIVSFQTTLRLGLQRRKSRQHSDGFGEGVLLPRFQGALQAASGARIFFEARQGEPGTRRYFSLEGSLNLVEALRGNEVDLYPYALSFLEQARHLGAGIHADLLIFASATLRRHDVERGGVAENQEEQQQRCAKTTGVPIDARTANTHSHGLPGWVR